MLTVNYFIVCPLHDSKSVYQGLANLEEIGFLSDQIVIKLCPFSTEPFICQFCIPSMSNTVPLETIGPFAAILPRSNRGFDLRFHLGQTPSDLNENPGLP